MAAVQAKSPWAATLGFSNAARAPAPGERVSSSASQRGEQFLFDRKHRAILRAQGTICPSLENTHTGHPKNVREMVLQTSRCALAWLATGRGLPELRRQHPVLRAPKGASTIAWAASLSVKTAPSAHHAKSVAIPAPLLRRALSRPRPLPTPAAAAAAVRYAPATRWALLPVRQWAQKVMCAAKGICPRRATCPAPRTRQSPRSRE